jgi:hypothetical protein
LMPGCLLHVFVEVRHISKHRSSVDHLSKG